MKPKILILGGGFAGLFTARELQKTLGNDAEIEIINSENYFVFQPLLPEVAAGSIAPTHAVSPLRYLLRGVAVRKAWVESVDFDSKTVTVFQGVQRRPTKVAYDHLVIALGQGSDLSRIPGMTEHGLTMKTLEDARRLRAHVVERLEHAEITGSPDIKRAALTFCVIGGGFSGIETVGEIKDLIDRSLKFYPNIRPEEIRVITIEFADRILGEMPESLSEYATEHLRQRGIDIRLKTGVASATATQLVTSADEVIDTRTIVATIGNAPSRVVRGMALPLQQGRIAVDRTLQVPSRDGVWSLGDCAHIPLKDDASERADFAPPTAQFAVREARHLARNVAAKVRSQPLTPFSYTSQGSLASLGAHRGVAEVRGRRVTGLPAWFLWRAYYLMFLPGIGTRVRVLVNWLLDTLSARNVVVLRSHQTPSVRHARYRAGDRVFEAGNRADGVYTVIEGEMELRFTEEATGRTVVRTLGPGEHFGERLILGDRQRSGTVRALTDSRVLILDRDAFLMMADGLGVFRDYFSERLREVYGLDWPPRDDPETQPQDAPKIATDPGPSGPSRHWVDRVEDQPARP